MATGFANIVGNKGGVAVSLRVNDTSMCFVNSHLPARAERLVNRNQDYQGLVEGLSLALKRVDVMNQFHHLFWLGDLNYRLVFKREKILQLIEIQHFDALLRGDQLSMQREEGKAFVDFQEGKLVACIHKTHLLNYS